jgi:hypothetical protein
MVLRAKPAFGECSNQVELRAFARTRSTRRLDHRTPSLNQRAIEFTILGLITQRAKVRTRFSGPPGLVINSQIRSPGITGLVRQREPLKRVCSVKQGFWQEMI